MFDMIKKFHKRLVLSNVLLLLIFGFVAILSWYFNTRKIGLINVLPSYYLENIIIMILSLIGIIKIIHNLWGLEAAHELI